MERHLDSCFLSHVPCISADTDEKTFPSSETNIRPPYVPIFSYICKIYNRVFPSTRMGLCFFTIAV